MDKIILVLNDPTLLVAVLALAVGTAIFVISLLKQGKE